MEAHRGRLLQVWGSGRSLIASGHPRARQVAEQCQELEGHWAELERASEAQAQCLQRAVTLRQVGRRGHRARAGGQSQAGSVSGLCGPWDDSRGGGQW